MSVELETESGRHCGKSWKSSSFQGRDMMASVVSYRRR